MAEQPLAAVQGDLLALLAQVDSDATGVKTFERYLWQAKQALRQWLTCLSGASGPLFVVCEQVEDITLVYVDQLRFLQLKTRDRGSWSALIMCDHGIEALVRSYNSARTVGLHERAIFELWLEGPISDSPDTVNFTKNPSTATPNVRAKIVKQGLRRAWLDDFLQRLRICPNQSPRAQIDATVTYELGAIWPMLSRPELDLLYERLLIAVTAAQAAVTVSGTIQSCLISAQSYISRDIPDSDEPGGKEIDLIRSQILSHAILRAITPPLPGESVEQLMSRISKGSAASMLELKMRAAGARSGSIQRMQALRADMEVKRQLLLSSRESAGAELEDLAGHLLSMANATAAKVNFSAVSNPSAAARPAEAIIADLLSRPGDLAQCDQKSIFSDNAQLIFGYLGHLSDECRFGWRAA
jgi:Cap4 dsDNA endonuclease